MLGMESNQRMIGFFCAGRSERLAASLAAELHTIQAQDATGCDLRPLRAQESDLINLADAANSTHNMLTCPLREPCSAPPSSVSGRRWRAFALATVRRPNRACRFPAHGFHEDAVLRNAKEGIKSIRLTSPYSR